MLDSLSLFLAGTKLMEGELPMPGAEKCKKKTGLSIADFGGWGYNKAGFSAYLFRDGWRQRKDILWVDKGGNLLRGICPGSQLTCKEEEQCEHDRIGNRVG